MRNSVLASCLTQRSLAMRLSRLLKANQLYTTTVETTRNVIGAYNLAQRMAISPAGALHLLQQSWTSAVDRSDPTAEHIRELDCRG